MQEAPTPWLPCLWLVGPGLPLPFSPQGAPRDPVLPLFREGKWLGRSQAEGGIETLAICCGALRWDPTVSLRVSNGGRVFRPFSRSRAELGGGELCGRVGLPLGSESDFGAQGTPLPFLGPVEGAATSSWGDPSPAAELRPSPGPRR